MALPVSTTKSSASGKASGSVGSGRGRTGSARGENPCMQKEPTFPEFERELLRKGITARAAGDPRCDDCHRTPLIGERIYRYDGGRVACELCRSRRRERPVETERIHSSEHGHAVRLPHHAAA